MKIFCGEFERAGLFPLFGASLSRSGRSGSDDVLRWCR